VVQVVLDLIEKKPNGLFTMLDEEIIVPKGTDQTFLKKINEEHGRNKNERFKQILTSPTKFGIHHYAGAVEYEVDNFLDKNKDTLHATIVEVRCERPSAWVHRLARVLTGGVSVPCSSCRSARCRSSPASFRPRRVPLPLQALLLLVPSMIHRVDCEVLCNNQRFVSRRPR
jgi:hypothetical protein